MSSGILARLRTWRKNQYGSLWGNREASFYSRRCGLSDFTFINNEKHF